MPVRNEEVIELYKEKNLTMQEIADRVGVSKARVRRVRVIAEIRCQQYHVRVGLPTIERPQRIFERLHDVSRRSNLRRFLLAESMFGKSVAKFFFRDRKYASPCNLLGFSDVGALPSSAKTEKNAKIDDRRTTRDP